MTHTHTHTTHTTHTHTHAHCVLLVRQLAQILGNPEVHLQQFCKTAYDLMGPRFNAGENFILCLSCQGGRIRSATASVLLAAILRTHHPELSVEVFLPHLCTGKEMEELHFALDFASGMSVSHSQLRDEIDEDSINISTFM